MNAMLQRLAGLLVAFGLVAVSFGAATVGTLWGFGLTCDDSCGTPPPWREDPDAWQWSALGWVGIAAFAIAVLFLIALAMRRRALSAVVAAAWTILAVGFIVLFDQSGLTSNAHRGWIGLGVIAAAFVASIVFTPERQPPPARS